MLQIENKNDTILYKYDNQGNTLEQKSSKGVISYTYDIYNRTRQVVTENGDIIKNKYDPLGFRYQKEVNGDTNRYIFDGWNVIAETNKEGELKSREVRGYSLVKKEKEETTYYYHQNEHGDVTHLTNVNGEVENSYSYDVFGSIREEKEAVFNYFKYSGEQYEKEIEQYYLRTRFYNPVIGRFTQEDVYRGDGLNLYVYVVNNPLLWVDPSGHNKCSIDNTSDVEEIYYFRGTTEGYEGNRSLQRIGVTPASTDPLVSTVFAIEAERYGKGIVYIASDSDLKGIIISEGNVLSNLEKEVCVEIPPKVFSEKASTRISVQHSREILNEMGYLLPDKIYDKQHLNSVLKETPRLNEDEIRIYVNQAKGEQ